MASLSLIERQKQIKKMRSGGMRLREIGEIYGIGKQRVGQILDTVYKNKTPKNKEENVIATKRNSRKQTLKRLGATIEYYEYLYGKQNGRCALCGTQTPGGNGSSFYVDHNHVSGKIRGLLCHWCNIGLGMFKDDKNLLLSAIGYLDSTDG